MPNCTICGATDANFCNSVDWPTKPNPPIFDEQNPQKNYSEMWLKEKEKQNAAPRIPVC